MIQRSFTGLKFFSPAFSTPCLSSGPLNRNDAWLITVALPAQQRCAQKISANVLKKPQSLTQPPSFQCWPFIRWGDSTVSCYGTLWSWNRLVSQALFGPSLKADHWSTPNVIYSGKDCNVYQKFTLFKGSRERTLIVRLKYRLPFVRNNWL